jgi:hypothetical protein
MDTQPSVLARPRCLLNALQSTVGYAERAGSAHRGGVQCTGTCIPCKNHIERRMVMGITRGGLSSHTGTVPVYTGAEHVLSPWRPRACRWPDALGGRINASLPQLDRRYVEPRVVHPRMRAGRRQIARKRIGIGALPCRAGSDSALAEPCRQRLSTCQHCRRQCEPSCRKASGGLPYWLTGIKGCDRRVYPTRVVTHGWSPGCNPGWLTGW